MLQIVGKRIVVIDQNGFHRKLQSNILIKGEAMLGVLKASENLAERHNVADNKISEPNE